MNELPLLANGGVSEEAAIELALLRAELTESAERARSLDQECREAALELQRMQVRGALDCYVIHHFMAIYIY